MPDDGIYQHDPDVASDDEFEAGRLAHLMPGNRGRMLDPRRTPVTVLAVEPVLGVFELRVEGFEDRGAHWRLAVEEVDGYQFAAGSTYASGHEVELLEAAVARFSTTIEVPVEPEVAAHAAELIAAERENVRGLLAQVPALSSIDIGECASCRTGSAHAERALSMLVRANGLGSLEHEFARTYVSNPASGEVVKGHAIVLAELGLRPYCGPPVRDPRIFSGAESRSARRAHILLRLAFLAELMELLGVDQVELHRGTATEREHVPRHARSRSFVSASFSREVALAHYRSDVAHTTLSSALVPVSRLFMTFLETAEMNHPYREAEALLIGGDGPGGF